jgi:hypothetical protein
MTLTAVPSRIRLSNTLGAEHFAVELQAIALALLQPIIGDRPINQLTTTEIEEYRSAINDLAGRLKNVGLTAEDNSILLIPTTINDQFSLDIACDILLNSIDRAALAVYLGSGITLSTYLGY